MTDTARDEHSQKNGALGNGNARGIPPSGVTVGAHDVIGHALTNQTITGQTETSRSVTAVSGTFGSTELESGVHSTVNAVVRGASIEASTPAVDLVLLSVTETQVAPGWAAAE